ncbi:MAG: hypothetical protein IJ991_17690 [Thermoguttaceae bacterium]|nr:hypothetical protein [Thermoguttaceae bacterium]
MGYMASLCRQGGAALLLGTAIWANGAEPSQPEPEKAEAQASESPEETPAAASEEASETPSESENVEAEASEERAGAKRVEA